MRRIKVEVAFTIDVDSHEDGVPTALERVSWIDAITFGLTEKDWEIVDNVHCNATRRLTYLGDPTTPGGMKKKRRPRAVPTKGSAK